jgi:membrane-bound lytic murein transglycosylase D
MLREYFLAAFLGLTLVITGCASTGSRNISDLAKTPPPEDGYEPSKDYGRVDLPINPQVQKWLNYYTGRGRKHMDVYLARSSRYIPMMKAVFRERGMPDELAYVALIESGFSSNALSHASAVGYWQFIRGTGTRYNLRIDSNVDERRDPILSTQAATNYLDSLFSLFGDWHLALASYNAGENRIQRAVMKYRTRDFWEIAKQRRGIHPETRDYVPKFIAAVYIAKDPEKYGFSNINFQPEFEFDSVVIDKPVSLDLLAKQMNIPYEDLKKMNPRYKSDFVPVYKDRTNAVRVPVGMKDLALTKIDASVATAPLHYVSGFEWYKVRRGDTLSTIARKFRTNMAVLRDLNDWNRKRTFLRAGNKIKVPDHGMSASVAPKRSSERSKRSPTQLESYKTYVVQKGDVLSLIAEKHGIGLSVLRSANRLSNRSMIRVGQRLRIPIDGEGAMQSERNKQVHVVRRGENLSTIAKKYRTSVSHIAKLNSLDNRALIFVGRKLVISD